MADDFIPPDVAHPIPARLTRRAKEWLSGVIQSGQFPGQFRGDEIAIKKDAFLAIVVAAMMVAEQEALHPTPSESPPVH